VIVVIEPGNHERGYNVEPIKQMPLVTRGGFWSRIAAERSLRYPPKAKSALLTNPAHREVAIRDAEIEPIGLSTAAAIAVGVTWPSLSNVLNADVTLSPDTALKVERAFGPKAAPMQRGGSIRIWRSHEQVISK
jgi:hypothetical protein